MSSIHEQITAAYENYLKESESFDTKGVKAAAARARKALGEMGKLAKSRRAEIQEKKKSEREIIFECMSFLFFLRLIVVQGLNHEQIKDIFILNTKKYLS